MLVELWKALHLSLLDRCEGLGILVDLPFPIDEFSVNKKWLAPMVCIYQCKNLGQVVDMIHMPQDANAWNHVNTTHILKH